MVTINFIVTVQIIKQGFCEKQAVDKGVAMFKGVFGERNAERDPVYVVTRGKK